MMELNHRENGDKLYQEGKFQEAYEEYRKMLQEGVKLTPHFNNRLLACARKSKKLDDLSHAFDLMTNISDEHFDLESNSVADFKANNASTYLWLLYDLIKADDFNVNLYLHEVLDYLDYCDDKNYRYLLAKILFKNPNLNKKLFGEFLDRLDFKDYSKELKSQDGNTIASEYEQLGYGMAKYYAEVGEYSKAEEICADLLALKEAKYKPFVINLQSEIALFQKDYTRAIEKKKQALEAKEDWFLYHQLGLIYREMGEEAKAGKYFTFALLKNRQNLGYLNKLLVDLRTLYAGLGEGEAVKLLDSLLYYERKKNNWSVSEELENAEKIEITEENFRKQYRTFRNLCKKILKEKLLAERKEGIVKSINPERRFGFLEERGGKSHHFSTNSLLDDIRDIALNDRVYFELTERFNPKKNIREQTCEYVIKI
ncbi:MAG TPA: hypothetical protein GYA05_02005 [Acholeplasmataceae bacterium]|nr:hypothetical protein [Acholeplasmataceae bacterium]